MNRCINKIDTSQTVIDSFFKSFLKNDNAYDPYQVSVWLRILDSFLNQVYKTSAVISKKIDVNLVLPFLKEFKMVYASGKSTTLRKDISEFLVWKFCLPFWKSYFVNQSNVTTFGDWFYTAFKSGLSRCLKSLVSPIFIGLSKMHGTQIVEKITIDADATTIVDVKAVSTKIGEIIDFNQNIISGVTVNNPAVLIKHKVRDKHVIKGYTCQIDSVVFNFTTNRLMKDQLSKHLK